MGLALAGLLAASVPLQPQASPVSVIGEFTQFSSAITPPNSVPAFTTVNGVSVTPLADGTPFQVPLGYADQVTFLQDSAAGLIPNVVQFIPGPAVNVSLGQEFLLGTFRAENGVWFGEADLSFSLRTVSADPAFDGFVFADTLHLHLNPFVLGRPDLGADFFYFLGHPQLGSIRAYELFDSPTGSNAGTIDFFGKIGSLTPTRFANAQGGVFFSPSVTPDPMLPVPEPGSNAILLILAFGSLRCLTLLPRPTPS